MASRATTLHSVDRSDTKLLLDPRGNVSHRPTGVSGLGVGVVVEVPEGD